MSLPSPERPDTNTEQRNPKRRRFNLARPRDRPTSPGAFHVAVFCALHIEAAAVKTFLDYHWEDDDPYKLAVGDQNAYTVGALGRHNVVLVHMPGMGKSQAAKAAADCLSSFPNVEIALLVGVCGGVPIRAGARDIMLGDVVVSEYVVQSDFGRRLPDGLLVKKSGVDALERPNAKIRAHISKIKSDVTVENTIAGLLSKAKHAAQYPGSSNDILFDPTYRHKHHDGSCSICASCTQTIDPACSGSIHATCGDLGCDVLKIIERQQSQNNENETRHTPSVHYGSYASADMVMRSGEERDEVAKKEGIVAFEMEAAGIWQSFPGKAVVVKSVCDYADSHKNKRWQIYSAFTAAAYMKVFLSYWVPTAQVVEIVTKANVLEDEENRKCLMDLRLTNPRDDKARIERTKGGLFLGASSWILNHPDFDQWRKSDDARLLWIKGDPGKGKTMLMITIIDELDQNLHNQEGDYLLSYFFCQGTDKDLNHATAVLRGLLYQLIMQYPPFISHLREAYDHSGSKLFEDGNSFFSLSRVLERMIDDPQCPKVYFVLDALDECSGQQELLLDLIGDTTEKFPHIRFIVSSRNVDVIDQYLRVDESGKRLLLEIRKNAFQVTQAVDAYINFQLQGLSSLPQGDHRRDQVRDILREKASGTFLWVALAIQELRKTPRHRLLRVLGDLPKGLTNLYSLMLLQARRQADDDWELCRSLLSAVTLAYQPLHIVELGIISGVPKDMYENIADMKSVLGLCGSFLTVQEDNMVYILHQSAQDYLKRNDTAKAEVFPEGDAHVHRHMYIRSLGLLSRTLKRNMYGLRHPGLTFETYSNLDKDPLGYVRYSVTHWMRHVGEAAAADERAFSRTGAISIFLMSMLLNWLEALCLLQALPDGITAVSRLIQSIEGASQQNHDLLHLVQDIQRFMRYFKSSIERYPLQVYVSGLVFCPTKSPMRALYAHKQPEWVQRPLAIPDQWNACRQVLENHSYNISNVLAYSPDGKQLAITSTPYEIRIWNTGTGVHERSLEGHTAEIQCVAYSPNGTQVASGARDHTVRLWCANTGVCQQIIVGREEIITSVAFSPDGEHMASSALDSAVWVSRSEMGNWVGDEVLWCSDEVFKYVVCWCDGKPLATGPDAAVVRTWRRDAQVGSWVEKHTTEGHRTCHASAAISPDGKHLAWASYAEDGGVGHAENGTWAHQRILEGHGRTVLVVAFSQDGKQMASGSLDSSILVWGIGRGSLVCKQILKGHTGAITSLAFLPDGSEVASLSYDGTARIWHVDKVVDEKDRRSDATPSAIALSPDGVWLVVASYDGTISVRHAETGIRDRVLQGAGVPVRCVAFSPDGSRLAVGSYDGAIRILDVNVNVDVEAEVCVRVLQGHTGAVCGIAFSHNGTWLASTGEDNTVRIWNTESGDCHRILHCETSAIDVAISPDNLCVAWTEFGQDVRIWHAETESRVTVTSHGSLGILPTTFSPDGLRLRVPSGDAFAVILPSLATSRAPFPGCGVSRDNRWVTWNGKPILWLPADYEPTCVSIGMSGASLAMHVSSGLFLLFSFEPAVLDDLVGSI